MRIDVTVKAEIIKARVSQISIYLCLETIWEILIMLETKKLIQQTLEELDNEHIYYLKYNGYNQEKNSYRYRHEYDNLVDLFLFTFVYGHDGLSNNREGFDFDGFYLLHGKWFAKFNTPQVMINIEEVLSGNNHIINDLKKKTA